MRGGGGQGLTSTSLFHQSPAWHRTVNMHCFYASAFSTSCFVLSAMDGKIEHRVCIKFCMKLGKSTTETTEMLCEAFEEHSLSRTAVFERHSRFTPSWVSVQGDQAPTKRQKMLKNSKYSSTKTAAEQSMSSQTLLGSVIQFARS
jgi:hypothetical protein